MIKHLDRAIVKTDDRFMAGWHLPARPVPLNTGSLHSDKIFGNRYMYAGASELPPDTLVAAR